MILLALICCSLYTLCRRLQIGCKIDSQIFLFMNCTYLHVTILLVHVVGLLPIQLVTHVHDFTFGGI